MVRYYRIDCAKDLEDAVNDLHTDVIDNKVLPWLHLEGHGFEEENGFRLASGAGVSWGDFKALITSLINITLGLNLVLILAACFGGSFALSIRTTDPAPVLGLIGPRKEVKVREIETGFKDFYQTFFDTSSLKLAIRSLNATAPEGHYYRTTAEQFFYEVWGRYKALQCTEAELHNRARKMYREAKKQNLIKTPSIGYLKRSIKRREPDLFNEYRDIYFMYEQHDDNRARLPVTYDEAEAKIHR